MSCKGLIGKILGHRLKAVYDTDEEMLSPKEIDQILASTVGYNYWCGFNNQIQPTAFTSKRVTKVYRGHVCLRCGEKFEDETLKI